MGGETVKQVSWDFKCLNACNPIIPGSNDVDMVTPLDFDKDGDMDVIVADANDSGDYYLVINMLADVFTLNGQAHVHEHRPGRSDPPRRAAPRGHPDPPRQPDADLAGQVEHRA